MTAVSMPDTPASLELDGGLFLRQPTLGDAPIIFAAVRRHRDDLRQWLPWVDSTESVADTIAFVESSIARRASGQAFVYGIWLDLDFIGVIDLHAVDALNASAQIGYWLAPPARRGGHMTQAAAAVLGLAFEIIGLERVEIRCASGNDASARIPEKLGFKQEATLRHAQHTGRGFADLRLFSLLSDEYQSLLGTV
ncbi:MAG: RimJ/RimL family protein N-acetyltransferase [Candidatus Solibacter sp.]|nr:RimJ/RimL family protein N-acetyltransferase [Candidatus Solibacter sp.]